MRKRRETLRVIGEFVLMVVLALAVIELLVLGTARAAMAHAEANAAEAASGEVLIPAVSSADSSPWAPRGACGREAASAPTGTREAAGSGTRELEYEVVLLDAHPETGRNDLDELRGFDGVLQNCTVTYYCCEARPHICGGGTGKTATGTDVTAGRSAAVDPDVIPLGAEIWVDYGDGVLHSYIAEDTGSAVTGGHIDLAVQTHEEALELGVREATVWWTE